MIGGRRGERRVHECHLHRARSAALGKANSPSLTAEFPAQEKAKSTSLKFETLSQYIYVTNEGNLGRSIYMLKLAQAESDFGLKSQHDDTSQKTNLKTNPKVKLKLSIIQMYSERRALNQNAQ